MRFRKIASALSVCLAFGVFTANAAQAADWTIGTIENQFTGGTIIPSGTHERITCKKHGTSSLVFKSTLLGSPVELTAEGIDCLESGGFSFGATIDNTTTKNHTEGVLTFTGVKVVKPANCSVAGGELTTKQLTGEVVMDPFGGSNVVYDKFFPEFGSFITIEFAGALCPLAEDSASVEGTLCGESVHTNAGGTGYELNNTGTLTKVQTLLFGEAQQLTGGCVLRFGVVTAQLSGAIDYQLSGANAGKPFGAD